MDSRETTAYRGGVAVSWVIGGLAASFGASLAIRGFRDRVHNGRSTLAPEPRGLSLTTHRARFVFDTRQRRIWLERDGAPPAHIKADSVRGVQVRVGFKDAGLEELVFEGFGITDMHREYRDHRLSWGVVLNTQHGPVTIAALSQYKKRDLWDFLTPLQHQLLGAMGLYEPGDQAAARIEGQFKAGLQSMGLNVRGGYEHLAATGALEGAPLPCEADLAAPAAPAPVRTPIGIDLPPPPSEGQWPSADGRR